jgi:hypothetical protein
MKALKHFCRDLGAQLWGIYGFRGGFNQPKTGLKTSTWASARPHRRHDRALEIQPALDAIGFVKDESADALGGQVTPRTRPTPF